MANGVILLAGERLRRRAPSQPTAALVPAGAGRNPTRRRAAGRSGRAAENVAAGTSPPTPDSPGSPRWRRWASASRSP